MQRDHGTPQLCSGLENGDLYWSLLPKMVKELIFNLTKGFNNVGSGEYKKVHIRGHYFSFFPTIIHDYLSRGILVTTDYVPSLKTIAKEVTRNVHDDWPSKDLLVVQTLE